MKVTVSDPKEWFVIDNDDGRVLMGPVGHLKAKKHSDMLNLERNQNTFACCKSIALRDGYINNFTFWLV